jgi:four helix bundle protein
MGDDGRMISGVRDLRVYRESFELAMEIFELSSAFPSEERYSLTSQIRRSSRSVSANVVEAWRKRRYEAAFVSRMSDAETEASETQVWIEFAVRCGYLEREKASDLYKRYESLIGSIVGMIHHADEWVIRRPHS